MTSGADQALSGVPRDHHGPDDRRRAVLRAALAVSQRRGYHGTTTERVAEAAGVEPAVVRDGFDNRGELLRHALDLAFQEFARETPAWSDTEPLDDVGDELERRLIRGIAAGVGAADFWRLGMLLNLEPLLADSDCGRLFLEVREETRQALRDYWRGIVPEHVASDPVLVELAVRGHVSLGDGSVLAAQAMPDWDLERMMRFVARGVAALLTSGPDEADQG